jgi:uncharacterized membrane protein YhiD involved in acid resistance
MAATLFLLRGVGLAIGAAIFGLAVVGLIEVWIARRDPARWRVIRKRGFRDNLRHMLN